MMNSLQNCFKYLRFVNIKTALQVSKEIKPDFKLSKNVLPATNTSGTKLSLSPRSIELEIGQKPLVGKIHEEPIKYVPIINPRSILPLVEDQWQRNEITLPTQRIDEMQMVRLIVIRRKKMKKHQRRKLYKRMKYRWARVKQRRRQVKEKIFQNELLAMVKAANEFSAEAYVQGKLDKANHTPLPTHWKGKRLPEFIIRQLLGLDKKINYKHTDVYKA